MSAGNSELGLSNQTGASESQPGNNSQPEIVQDSPHNLLSTNSKSEDNDHETSLIFNQDTPKTVITILGGLITGE